MRSGIISPPGRGEEAGRTGCVCVGAQCNPLKRDGTRGYNASIATRRGSPAIGQYVPRAVPEPLFGTAEPRMRDGNCQGHDGFNTAEAVAFAPEGKSLAS